MKFIPGNRRPAKPVARTRDQELAERLLRRAFEGGSNYWCEVVRCEQPSGTTKHDYASLPMSGGAVIVRCIGGDQINGASEWRIDHDAVKRGLAIFPRTYVQGEAADVFLQCCVFGEMIFK